MRELKDGRGLLTVGRTQVSILKGEDDLSDWTDEELRRGQRISKSGDWSGRPPQLVARQIHEELVKRKLKRATELLKTSSWKAVKVLAEIATDRQADYNIRLKAATEILDRSIGKPREHVDMTIEAPWQRIMATAIVNSVDGDEVQKALEASNGDVIEGEAVEELTIEEPE
jgi:hypothetical protein